MGNVQFISAKDLPMAEGNDVNALCVENGELKQKPVSGMGGGAGGYVIRLKAEWMMEESDESNMLFRTDICYDEIAELVYNGGTVWIDVSVAMGMFVMALPAMVAQMGDEYMLMVAVQGGAVMIGVYMPAGTWQPPTVE